MHSLAADRSVRWRMCWYKCRQSTYDQHAPPQCDLPRSACAKHEQQRRIAAFQSGLSARTLVVLDPSRSAQELHKRCGIARGSAGLDEEQAAGVPGVPSGERSCRLLGEAGRGYGNAPDSGLKIARATVWVRLPPPAPEKTTPFTRTHADYLLACRSWWTWTSGVRHDTRGFGPRSCHDPAC